MIAWARVETNLGTVLRAKVPGGWMVIVTGVGYGGAFFYPDPEYRWRAKAAQD